VPNLTRCLEATGVPRLNAQSPSELPWRLRIKPGHIYGFDNMIDLKHTISLMDPAAAGPLPRVPYRGFPIEAHPANAG
jgi:hypothetical protein